MHVDIHDIPWSDVLDLLGHIPSLTVFILAKVSSFLLRSLSSIVIYFKPSMPLTAMFVTRIENAVTCVCGVGRQRMCQYVCHSAWRKLNLVDFLDVIRR